jgi:transcriptional regulator with XRE-family HTH domain
VTEFARLLVVARDRAHLSRRTLATRAGIATQYLARLEIGEHQPSREVVEMLADAMSMDSYSRALLLVSAGYVPLMDRPFCQLVAHTAAFWAQRNLTESPAG